MARDFARQFIVLVCGVLFAAQALPQAPAVYEDETAFLAALNSPTLIDFEGIAAPGSFVFLGNPGEFAANGVIVSNNSQMFVQNINSQYGSGSFLSPQGGDTQRVFIQLPPDTVAVGFSYAYAETSSASAVLEGDVGLNLTAPEFGTLGFFGVYRETGIEYVVVVVDGGGIDLDDLWFLVDPNPTSSGTFVDEAAFLNELVSPVLIDFEGIVDVGEDLFLGTPGSFSDAGVTISNNSQMFVRNVVDDIYGTGSFLSPQGVDPQVVQFELPPSTIAVGLSYSYRNYASVTAKVSIGGSEEFLLTPEPAGGLGFFGAVRSSAFDRVTVTVTGSAIDFDNVWFLVDPSVQPVQYRDETAFLSAVNAPTLIDFEGIVGPGEFVGYGDPGAFVEAGVRIANQTNMFVQNNNYYGTLSYLSPQGGVSQNILIQLPPDTQAVGFSYSASAATATINDNEIIELSAILRGELGFVGLIRDTPITSISVNVNDTYFDMDDFWFVRSVDEPGPRNLPGGGDVDLNFGDDGVLRLTELFNRDFVEFFSVGVQPSGQIVIAGSTGGSGVASLVEVARIELDGTLDTTFGSNGYQSYAIGAASARVSDMKVLADGSLLLSGSSRDDDADLLSFLVKLDSNGALDTSFGNGGIVVNDLDSTGGGTVDGYERVVVRSDGSILLGTAGLGVYQLDSNGNDDASFGNLGRASPHDDLWASFGLAESADGGIVFGGGTAFLERPQDFILGRYLSDGSSLDPSFGVNGIATAQLSLGNDDLLDLAIDYQGRIVALGYTNRPGTYPIRTALVRFTPNGTLDTTFGYNGIRILDGIAQRDIYATRILLRPDGGMLLSGQTESVPPDQEIFVLSLNEDGSLDESFAGRGWQELDVEPSADLTSVRLLRDAMVLHPSGRIVVLNWVCGCMTMLEAPHWNDTDGDGLSDRIDPDDDNDGVNDVDDAFPLDATEAVDTDRDGVGNNADADDDGDGLSDIDETSVYGTNSLRRDTDGDGLDDGAEIQNGLDPLDPNDCPEELCPTGSSILRLLPIIQRVLGEESHQ